MVSIIYSMQRWSKIRFIAASFIIVLLFCVSACSKDSTGDRHEKKIPLSTELASKEAISQIRLWIDVFRGRDAPIYRPASSGIVKLDGDDVLIFDESATGSLIYEYPVPINSSLIVITPVGGLVIRNSLNSIPKRYINALPLLKKAVHKLNSTPGLQRRPTETLGSWYARILTAMVSFMENSY